VQRQSHGNGTAEPSSGCAGATREAISAAREGGHFITPIFRPLVDQVHTVFIA
jgi:hypothetical protein